MNDLFWSLYIKMLRIRVFEDRLAELVENKEVGTPSHLYVGQEAVAAGVCENLTVGDLIWGNHRSHGHYIAKGGNLISLMSEIFGKETGCSKGRGGSMHVIDNNVGIVGTVPIVAATIPLAVGGGFTIKMRNENKISVAFFGDGAIEEGHFHESVNIAAINKLPVLFVCENNLYSSHLHLLERRMKDNIVSLGDYHGIDSYVVDGNNVEEVYNITKEAIYKIKNNGGPIFIECRTFRWRGHVGGSYDIDVGLTRKGELKEWMQKDPIKFVENKLINLGYKQKDLDMARSQVHEEVETSVNEARKASYPDEERVLKYVYS